MKDITVERLEGASLKQKLTLIAELETENPNYAFELDDPRTLVHKVYVEKMPYYAAYYRNVFVAGAGRIGQDLMKRTWIHPEYRGKLRPMQHLLAVQARDLLLEYGDDCVCFISFHTNEALYKAFERRQEGKSHTLGESWPGIYNAFHPTGVQERFGVMQGVCRAQLSDILFIAQREGLL